VLSNRGKNKTRAEAARTRAARRQHVEAAVGARHRRRGAFSARASAGEASRGMVSHVQGAGGGPSGCCRALHLGEDNARFVLLAAVLLLYMVAGAALFQFLEQDTENAMVHRFWDVYADFHRRLANESSRLDMGLVHQLLYAYGNATAVGIVHKRRRWDFAGSFHFVGTIVSTIGEIVNK
jgi:hypothetical protein